MDNFTRLRLYLRKLFEVSLLNQKYLVKLIIKVFVKCKMLENNKIIIYLKNMIRKNE